jgi:pseudouridine synthase
MRLQKFMADAGIGSRRKCEELITAGLVRLNGEIATIGAVVRPEIDLVEYDGKIIKAEQERVVLMLNKPRGVICTASDPQGRPTVMEYFRDLPYRVYNIGRLDYDSEGLLLFTNDGELAYRLTHPAYEIPKTYIARIEGTMTEKDLNRIRSGVELDGVLTKKCKANIVETNKAYTKVQITITEGRNRQVRRMFEAIGRNVELLKRVSIGKFKLKGLNRGEVRALTELEIEYLKGM